MAEPIVFRGLTREQAEAIVRFHEENGAQATMIPDGTGLFSVSVVYPDSPPPETGGPRPDGTFNMNYSTYFIALVPHGFYSSDPDDLNVRRSVRTNNPGALNISAWQRDRLGFVSVTQDDGHGNVTSIYSSPEYGVAAWYFLLSDRYRFASLPDRSFTIQQLARKYAGGNASSATVANYVNGWSRLAERPISRISLDNDSDMLNLARAMYKLESGQHLQINNDQILFGIQKERSQTLPNPPTRP